MALSTSDLRSILAVLAIGSLVLGTAEASVVRRIAELKEFKGVPGLIQRTLAGAEDGHKELGVWRMTYSPGYGTPIHRHEPEEVIVVLKGGGTLYMAPDSENDFPGEPEAFPFFANSTFSIPVNTVHQMVNTNDEDMEAFVILSTAGSIRLHIYKDWNTRHEDATPFTPPWSKLELEEAASTKDEL